jgi:hypothetical protein
MRRIVGGADRVAGALGLSPGSRSAAQLVELARRRTNPLGSVAALYERFGLTFSNEFASRIVASVAEWPQGGYRRNKPSLEDYGLDPETERRWFRAYIECFGVP